MKAKAYYEDFAPREVAVPRRILKAADLLRRHAPRRPRFLDIGCGTGEATKAIAGVIEASYIAGFDIADNLVQQARSEGIDARFADLDSGNAPFEARSFDAIHCGEVIEHVADTDHLLDEIERLLSPGGVCALSTPNLAAWYNRGALLLGYQPLLSEVSYRHAVGRPSFAQADRGGGHLRMFTRRALRELVTLHGFEIIAERGVGVFELGDPPGSVVAKTLIAPLDALLTRIPAVACDVLLGLRKRDSDQ